MNGRFLTGTLTLTIGLLLGWLLIKTPSEEKQPPQVNKTSPKQNASAAPDPKSERKNSNQSKRNLESDPNALPLERIIAFSNERDLQDFLKKLTNSNIRNLGKIGPLNALRLGFDHLSDLAALSLDPDDLQFNYSVNIPELPDIEPQPGLVGFGPSALRFLGITTDNSTWGEGVRIAVIDSGIQPHLALSKDIEHINLVEIAEGATPDSHGTSVASLIAGTHPNLRGVAPASDLISVRIVDESGSSSSFLLAQGLIAAADAGAHLINISLGSSGDSPIVRQAVTYATERGSVIFASSGNSGLDNAAFPAAYPEVHSVGAVDALGQYVNFSNTDSDLSLAAPGYEVTAAFPGDNITSFTGTSASVAFPIGAVAAIMTQSDPPVSAQRATQILIDHANEAGSPGTDPEFGNGIINLGRALQRDTPGIIDLAVASQNYLAPDLTTRNAGGLQVSIENRGTEAVFQSSVDISIAGDFFPVTIQSLQANERRVITIPTGFGLLQREGELRVQSQVTLSDDSPDLIPTNDRRDDLILLSPDEN